MKSTGIYVEIPIKTTMDKLWNHTQDPALHQQWDLRFTTIDYLPKPADDLPQRFLYTTKIGFGVKISGQGESKGTTQTKSKVFTSALKFWSDSPISLIASGSGFWKYIPTDDGVKFLTWYDYKVRFGLIGKWFDQLAFRPLIGWATAWSFDVLRIWLEKGVSPALSLKRSIIHFLVQVITAVIWIYQGLVPKILFPDSGEIEILSSTGLARGFETSALFAIGLGEILFGSLFLFLYPKRSMHYLNILILFGLIAGASLGQTHIFVQPFNPVTLTLAMVALSFIGIFNHNDLPTSVTCLRKPQKN